MRILCMLSGGIDSIGMLYYLLTNEKYKNFEIHAHFIRILNKEKRIKAEVKAIELCLNWLKNNCRDFLFTESAIDFTMFRYNFPYDVDLVNFTIGEIIATSTLKYDYVSIGRTKTDRREYVNVEPIYQNSEKILETILSIYSKDIQKIYPIDDLEKIEVWNLMPEELRKNTWSCRTPIYIEEDIIPCGECRTCIELKKDKIGFYAE